MRRDDGARLNESSHEANDGRRQREGSAPLQKFFEYRPTYKLHLMTNHKPRVVNTDFGVWRRLLLLPYTQRFTLENGRSTRRSTRRSKVRPRVSWRGSSRARAATWPRASRRAPRYGPPAPSTGTRKIWSASSSENRCVIDRDASAPVAGVYASYAAWAKESGAFALSKKRLVTELTERPLSISLRRVGHKNETTLFGIKLL
jgi:putative DNA primase/helicase